MPTRSARARRILHRLVPPVILIVFTVALMWRCLLGGQSLYWGDIFLYFQPQQEFVARELTEGRLPLWNPYVLCGQPLVGNPQSWVFYPTSILAPFMPAWRFLVINTWLHLLITALGCYRLSRRLFRDRVAATCSAICFVGSGFLVARLQFPTMVQAAAWLPWLLLVVDRLTERPNISNASYLALVMALEILAGHAQLAYMSFLLALAFSIVRMAALHRQNRFDRRILSYGAFGVIVGVGLSLVQVLPILQLFSTSTREHLTWAQANRFVLRPTELIGLMFPYSHGDPQKGNFWGAGNFWESCVYVGIVPLALAIYGARSHPKRPFIRFFLFTSILTLILSMGKYGGLYFIAFTLVPGLSKFHDPARFSFLFSLGVALLAGAGIRSLHEKHIAPRWLWGVTTLIATSLWRFGANVQPTLNPTSFDYRPRAYAFAPPEGTGRIYSVLRDDVWRRYLNYSDYGPESARYAHELTNTFSPNLGMRFEIEEAGGYEPVPISQVTEVDGVLRRAIARQSPTVARLLQLMNVQLILMPLGSRYRHPDLIPCVAAGTVPFRVRLQAGRAWGVRKVYIVHGTTESITSLAKPDFDPLRYALVSSDPGLTFSRMSDESPVSVIDGPTPQSFIVDAGKEPALLVVSQTAYPGWEAKVDGHTTRIIRTDHAFTGVAVGKGRHVVSFRYAPAVFRLGLYCLSVCSAITTAALMFGWSRRRHMAKERAVQTIKPTMIETGTT